MGIGCLLALIFVGIPIAIIIYVVRKRRSANAKREVGTKNTVSELHPPYIPKEKEIIKEKEVIKEREIVKVRCSYCQQLYNEADGRCPNCGGR
jgi:aspartate carbamoyltransferase regulatory subunit